MLGKVELCGVNTSRLKVLKNDEMMELMTRYKNGDQKAMQQMVEGNLRLVLSVIQRFDRSGENPDDLFQVGCIGLIKAIQNFNPDMMVKFSTYGVPMISGEIRRFLRDNAPIRVSRSLRDTAYRVLQTRESILRERQKEPTMEEIAASLELSVDEVNAAMDAIASPVSLHDPIYSDGGDPLTVMDQVRDTKNTDEMWIEHIALREAIKNLDEREKRILALRFYDGRTQMEVADQVGISQAQVSRLEKSAISQIRKAISVQ
ncbi:MAG: RNA polymerase sporulation sigma factor SigG [Oscillospiraceae bacterium]|nr:RNA polymerase sporulation sigma factor SigG [Oscillospiraceae bacterium]